MAAVFMAWLLFAMSQGTASTPPDPKPQEKPAEESRTGGGRPPVQAADPSTVTVIGSKEDVSALPGSGAFLDAEDIRRFNYDDIHQVLRKVPGVYVREEEGYGLFPNLSLRGVDTTRSAKVTMMEDGVLTAPAPYSAPDAYYSPTAGRMHGIEVLKGSSQVRYGPHITGGVVNYLSTPIPEDRGGVFRTAYGSYGDVRAHAYYGGTQDLGDGASFGYLGEFYYRTVEGFKQVDRAPDFGDTDDTGFTNVEPMFKLRWSPGGATRQSFELKYGYTDRDANETYLGLSPADFDDDPYRRYAASRFDNIVTEQHRAYLRHRIELGDLSVDTTLYYNRFERNWYKLNDLRDIDTDGDGIGDGLNMDLSAALAGAGAGAGLDVLRGERAGGLRVRANNREYYAYGLSIDPTWVFETGDVAHEVKFGLRCHYDQVKRFQHQDVYQQASNGAVTDVLQGAPGTQDDRLEETTALAFYIQDSIAIGALTLTPGVRIERLMQEDDRRLLGLKDDVSYTVAGGGLGARFEVSEAWTVFGGVHRGYSTPSPGGAVVGDLREETGIAYELGVRHQDRERGIRAEVVGFLTRFDDLIVIDNIGGGGGGDDENVGRVDALGLELLLQADPGTAGQWGVGVPLFLSLTLTRARLNGDSNSTDPESIFAGGEDGAEVPYIPELVLTLGAGVESGPFGLYVTASYVAETYTSALNRDEPVNGAGAPDARFGTTDDRWVVDLTANYRLADRTKVFGGVQNLLDEEYVASRHPHGPRPGAPIGAYLGLEVGF